MKKIFSIAVAFLMLLSGLQLTVYRHYCGGELAQAKVSLWGQSASCGMEEESGSCSQTGMHLESTGCCDNKVSVYSVDHNYSPSYSVFKVFPQNILHVFVIPASINFHSFTAFNFTGTDTSPPGNLLVHAVSLPKICVFLI